MRASLLEILVAPISKEPLRIETEGSTSGDELIEGVLRSDDGSMYSVTAGIPRFVMNEDSGQEQIRESFGFKWEQRGSYESTEFQDNYHQWLRQKYGFKTDDEMSEFFGSKRRTLEVGCGGGLSASVSLSGNARENEWVGMDISQAIDIARTRLGHLPGTHFVQADILRLPFREQTFDAIFAEGVLHHTPSTENAIKRLSPLLTAGGEILFYVYRKKGPIREFTDDYVRGLISHLSPAEAWDLLRPLTKLGRALAELKTEVMVPEDIPYLGIKAGSYDVQRLIYWHFAKLFWNEQFPFETNNHINFDWYHPRYAHRQTREDLQRWCDESDLKIGYLDEQESGFTVRAVKG